MWNEDNKPDLQKLLRDFYNEASEKGPQKRKLNKRQTSKDWRREQMQQMQQFRSSNHSTNAMPSQDEVFNTLENDHRNKDWRREQMQQMQQFRSNNHSTNAMPSLDEAFNTLKNDQGNKGFYNVDFISSVVIVILKIVIGTYYYNDCPANDWIPLFFILDALRSMDLAIFVRYFKNTRMKRMTIVTIVLVQRFFIYIWYLLGIYWICKVFFNMSTDASSIGSQDYCSFTLYYSTVFFIVFPFPMGYVLILCLKGVNHVLNMYLATQLDKIRQIQQLRASVNTTADVHTEGKSRSTTSEVYK